jgi:hypothetical protein
MAQNLDGLIKYLETRQQVLRASVANRDPLVVKHLEQLDHWKTLLDKLPEQYRG